MVSACGRRRKQRRLFLGGGGARRHLLDPSGGIAGTRAPALGLGARRHRAIAIGGEAAVELGQIEPQLADRRARCIGRRALGGDGARCLAAVGKSGDRIGRYAALARRSITLDGGLRVAFAKLGPARFDALDGDAGAVLGERLIAGAAFGGGEHGACRLPVALRRIERGQRHPHRLLGVRQRGLRGRDLPFELGQPVTPDQSLGRRCALILGDEAIPTAHPAVSRDQPLPEPERPPIIGVDHDHLR